MSETSSAKVPIAWGHLGLILIGAALLTGCTVSNSDADDAFAAYGLTNAKLGGFALFGCDEKDTFKSTFTATGPTGQRVKGVLCRGVFKGTTVRITGKA